MENVFMQIVNMSITAGWLVLAVMLLRLLLYRAPKWVHCLLWGMVGVRLLCPISIESVLSIIPSAETVPTDTFLYDSPSIHSGVPLVDQVVNPVISNSFAPTMENSVNPMQVIVAILSVVWVVGIAVMLTYMVVTTWRLRRQVKEAVLVRDNVFQCDRIATPFILGVIRPRIYLPSLLGAVETQSVLTHEQAHLNRRDHWWKPLGFLLLAVYWFNPLLWVGYILLCRDIEAACDQCVVRNMDAEERREYSRVLLSCSAPRRLVTACPLAFGETGVKTRIKAVLHYKKPAFWIVVAAVVVALVAAVCLLTNPRNSVSDDLDAYLSEVILEQNRGEHTADAYPVEAHTVFGVDNKGEKTVVYGMVLYEEYCRDENGALQVQSGSHCPTVITVEKGENGYSLVEYWIPRDGSVYVTDIRDKFPARHQGKALDTDGHYGKHHEKTLEKAQKHFANGVPQNTLWKNVLTLSAMDWLSQEKQEELYKEIPVNELGAPYLPLLYMGSCEDLDSFIEKYKNDFNMDRAEGDGLMPSHQMREAYNEAFFADNVLFAVYYKDGSCSVQPKVVDVSGEKGSDTLSVQVDVYEPYGQDQALGQWFMLVEVPRIMLDGVTKWNARVRCYIAADCYAAAFETPVSDSSVAKELWRDRLTDEEQMALRSILNSPNWLDAATVDLVSIDYQWVFHLNGTVHYVSEDFSTVYDGKRYYDTTTEERAFFKQLYAPRGATTSGTPYPTDPNTFVGRVTQVTVNNAMMLMECYDTDKFTQVWVSLDRFPDLNPSVGMEYVVTHTGQVMETFPLQVVAVSVEHVSSTPTTSTQVESSSSLSFTGRVTEVESDRVLMECYDKNKFDTVWVNIGMLNVLSPKVGEEYVVTYEDMMMPSLPPIITAVTMELKK